MWQELFRIPVEELSVKHSQSKLLQSADVEFHAWIGEVRSINEFQTLASVLHY
jgi:hypothetical protein